jgi:hypothetical protein
MLTVNCADITKAVTLEHSHLGVRVFLGEDLMGTIEELSGWMLEKCPEWCLLTDDVYVALNTPYNRLEQAVAAVTADYLVKSSHTLSDYF